MHHCAASCAWLVDRQRHPDAPLRKSIACDKAPCVQLERERVDLAFACLVGQGRASVNFR
jgi:hypothetical protein